MSGALMVAAAPGLSAILSGTGPGATQTSFSPDDARVAYRLTNSGVERTAKGTSSLSYTDTASYFFDPNATEARLTGTGDTPGGDSINTWLALTVSRQWQHTQTVVGERVFTGTIEIRDKGSQQVLVSASVTLRATVEI